MWARGNKIQSSNTHTRFALCAVEKQRVWKRQKEEKSEREQEMKWKSIATSVCVHVCTVCTEHTRVWGANMCKWDWQSVLTLNIRAQAATWGNYSAFLSRAALAPRAWRRGSHREPGFHRSPKIPTLGYGECAGRGACREHTHPRTHTQSHLQRCIHAHTNCSLQLTSFHTFKDIYAAHACIVITYCFWSFPKPLSPSITHNCTCSTNTHTHMCTQSKKH